MNTLEKNVQTLARDLFGKDTTLLGNIGRDFLFLVDGERIALRYSLRRKCITLIDKTGVGISATGTSRSMFDTEKKKRLPFDGKKTDLKSLSL